jgi:hypothetical protein
MEDFQKIFKYVLALPQSSVNTPMARFAFIPYKPKCSSLKRKEDDKLSLIISSYYERNKGNQFSVLVFLFICVKVRR